MKNKSNFPTYSAAFAAIALTTLAITNIIKDDINTPFPEHDATTSSTSAHNLGWEAGTCKKIFDHHAVGKDEQTFSFEDALYYDGTNYDSEVYNKKAFDGEVVRYNEIHCPSEKVVSEQISKNSQIIASSLKTGAAQANPNEIHYRMGYVAATKQNLPELK